MKVIYTAGPFTADSVWGERKNIRRAEEWALSIWKAGHVAMCPHANTANFSGELDADGFIAGDLELLSRCDAVLMLPEWERSRGARIEKAVAEILGIPLFYWNKPLAFQEFLQREEG